MTNYIKTFSDETAYSAFTATTAYVTPNVSYCSGGSNSVFFNSYVDYSKDYFTLVALEDGQFKFTAEGCGAAGLVDSHYYSIDNGQTWTELPIDTYTPTITAGNRVLWKNNMSTGEIAGAVSSTGMFDAQGNVMSLVYGDNFANQTSLEGYKFVLNQLFIGSNIKNANNLSLPATTLADGCYANMYQDCTSLKTAPVLPATTLTRTCYYFMFEGCTSLNSITCLATDISAEDCTYCWVNGVAATGTFTKAANMSSWTTGVNGIPSGWSIVDK